MRYALRAFLVLVMLCTLFLAACGNTSSVSPKPAPSTISLNVFAAASLTESFNEIAMKYEKAHPNIKITLNFNGSQILEQQIANGAPADMFASADMANMQKASNAGLVGTSQVFVKNRLVVIIPANNPGNISSLHDLARKGVKIDIEASNVPAGKYSLQVLDKMSKSPSYGPGYESAVK